MSCFNQSFQYMIPPKIYHHLKDLLSHLVIKPAILDKDLMKLRQTYQIDRKWFEKMWVIKLSIEIKKKIKRKLQNLNLTDHYSFVKVSFEDFALAYVGELFHLPIISYDHHILTHLPQWLDFLAIAPDSLEFNPNIKSILLDTNILYSLLPNQPNDYQTITKKCIIQSQYIIILEEIKQEFIRITSSQKILRSRSRLPRQITEKRTVKKRKLSATKDRANSNSQKWLIASRYQYLNNEIR